MNTKLKNIVSKLFINISVGVITFSSSIMPVAAVTQNNKAQIKTAGVFAGVGSSIGSNITGSVVSCMSRGGIFAALEDYSNSAVDSEEKIAEYLTAYDNVAIAKVHGYVNIRKNIGENSPVVGKLYDKSMGTIIKSRKGWYKIKSGRAIGWVKSEFVVTGNAARKLAAKVGTRIANVKTTTLRVRKKASKESPTLDMVPDGEKLLIVKESKDWLKVEIDEDIKGWIAKEFVDITTEFQKAETIEEENERLRREAAERVVVVDNTVVERNTTPSITNNRNNNNNRRNNSNNNNNRRNNRNNRNNNNNNRNNNNNNYSVSNSGYGKGADVANYALNFVGNPYRYGGTSLTNGTDCSGFTKGVYSKFGVSLPRSSSSQRSAGKLVCNGWDPSKAKAGDIVCYNGHVAIYMGGGKIVHASSRKTGIKISNRVNYRKVVCVRRIF